MRWPLAARKVDHGGSGLSFSSASVRAGPLLQAYISRGIARTAALQRFVVYCSESYKQILSAAPPGAAQRAWQRAWVVPQVSSEQPRIASGSQISKIAAIRKGGGLPQLYYQDCSGTQHTPARSHHKGAAPTRMQTQPARVRTGDRRYPVLCFCQLGQDIPCHKKAED